MESETYIAWIVLLLALVWGIFGKDPRRSVRYFEVSLPKTGDGAFEELIHHEITRTPPRVGDFVIIKNYTYEVVEVEHFGIGVRVRVTKAK